MTHPSMLVSVSKSLLIVIGTLPGNTACGECRPVESRLPTGLGRCEASPTHSTGPTTASPTLPPATPETQHGKSVAAWPDCPPPQGESGVAPFWWTVGGLGESHAACV
jgi:hypothetical protein